MDDKGESTALIAIVIVAAAVAVVGGALVMTMDWGGEAPAKFEIDNLKITPSKVDYGDSATVSIDVTNTGDKAENCALVLKVDNKTENTRETFVDGGETEKIHYDVAFDFSGKHVISVENLSRNIQVNPTGELERRENSKLPSSPSLDPWDDLLTGKDIPDALVEQSELEWKYSDNSWYGIPFDQSAFRYWMDSAGERAVGIMGFVCPTESDARDILQGLGNFWRDYWTSSYPTGDFSHTPFPLYGEERESFKLTLPQGEGYLINFRIQNVTVGIVATQMEKSEAENYTALVEERIKTQ